MTIESSSQTESEISRLLSNDEDIKTEQFIENHVSLNESHQLFRDSENAQQLIDQCTPFTASLSSSCTSDESTHDALDALAALASRQAIVDVSSEISIPHQRTSSSDDDSESMPTYPPATMLTSVKDSLTDNTSLIQNSLQLDSKSHSRLGRLRSASNPEGMEKWDSYCRRNDRQHFVLPSSILEEELASTRRVLGEQLEDDGDVTAHSTVDTVSSNMDSGVNFTNCSYYDKSDIQEFTMITESSDYPVSYSTSSLHKIHLLEKPMLQSTEVLGTSPNSVTNSNDDESAHMKEEQVTDESSLEPEELLRMARCRLLEDLSEGSSFGGEKGVLTLPHSLSKYKEIYNKNGRIGIYTPAERAVIITKFNAKRARRVWNKKIRYNCRKNLADRRMRVKGRFVKRCTESSCIHSTSGMSHSVEISEVEDTAMENNGDFEIIKRSVPQQKVRNRPHSPPKNGNVLQTVNENEESHDDDDGDEDMPDVEDEEGGFSPTEDMPYRRTRRYTIT